VLSAGAAGAAVAGPYSAILAGLSGPLGLPRGWVAELVAAGLWIRPAGVTEAEQDRVRGLPPPADGGLIVIGAAGHGVADEVWLAVRPGLESLTAAGRGRLRAEVIDVAASAHRLADLVAVTQVVTKVAGVPGGSANAIERPRRAVRRTHAARMGCC
jgi:hypothetical protein